MKAVPLSQSGRAHVRNLMDVPNGWHNGCAKCVSELLNTLNALGK